MLQKQAPKGAKAEPTAATSGGKHAPSVSAEQPEQAPGLGRAAIDLSAAHG